MLRIGMMLFVLLLLGTQLLSFFGDTAELSSLILFVLVIAIAIVVLKLTLDFVLHGKKSREDEEIEHRFGEDDNVKTYEDINEYMKAAKRRDQRH